MQKPIAKPLKLACEPENLISENIVQNNSDGKIHNWKYYAACGGFISFHIERAAGDVRYFTIYEVNYFTFNAGEYFTVWELHFIFAVIG